MALVLIVDDSRFQRGLVRKLVAELGHEAIEAENGRDALDCLKSEMPDIVISDLVMPEMGGIEFLGAMSQSFTDIPVIVLTSDIQAAVREECLSLGAVGFLNKPFKRSELLASLTSAMALHEV